MRNRRNQNQAIGTIITGKPFSKRGKPMPKDDNIMNTCPTCNGDGTVFVKSTDLTKNPPTETGFDLPCHTCDGEGEITEDQLKAKLAMDEMMCSCEEPTFGSYPTDGECDCGMYKHHVHCGTCGKISQIG